MAYTDRVHGDAKQVMNYDAPGYTVGAVNAVTSGVTVQPAGPKLDFGTITFNGHVTGDQINTVIQTLQQLATIYVYEFTTGGSNDTLAVGVYPTGAWNFANGESVDAAVSAALNDTCSTAATATFTN